MHTENRPQRTCVACRENKAQDQLIRYVLAPDGRLTVDYRHRLPGRGAYTCIRLACLQAAVERKQFQRSLRGQHQDVVFVELKEELQQAIEQKIINLLGMGRKSGQLISGSNNIITQLRRKTDLALVIMTTDISMAIAEKVTALADRRNVSCWQFSSKDQLGRILGKGERSVVALPGGTLADTLQIELRRYKQLVREN